MSENGIIIEVQQLTICGFCLMTTPIILFEVYLLYLFIKVLVEFQRIAYDKIDRALFVLSVISVSVDLLSLLIVNKGISVFTLIAKIVWSHCLFLVFLRFALKRQQCEKWYVIITLFIIFFILISLIFFRIVPLNQILLLVYLLIWMCSLQQIVNINGIISKDIQLQKQLKENKSYKIINQYEIQLLDRTQFQFKVISKQFKYHLYLRRNFCIVFSITFAIIYFLLFHLEESKNGLGEFFTILIIEHLPLIFYYFYICVNQWIVNVLNQ